MTAARESSGWGAYSHAGLVRAINEDSVLASPPIYAVADGLGGHEAGEVASRLAIDTLLAEAPRGADAKGLARAARSANRAVIQAAEQGRGREGMGTTLTAAMVDGTRVAIAHVGDSRAYLLSGGELIQLTDDHSMVADMVRAGTLSEADARWHPNRSVITRALGTDPDMTAETYEVDAAPGDRLLLCTDGLHGMVPDERIAAILGDTADPSAAVRRLVDAALDAGGQDNVSAVVVDLAGERAVHGRARTARRRAAPLLWLLVAIALVGGATWATWTYARSQAFLVDEGGRVAVYRGVPGSFAGVTLAWRAELSTVPVSALPPQTAARLAEGIRLEDLDDAYEALDRYRSLAASTTNGG